MKEDKNKLKEFSEWLDKTFDWVDLDLKRYMRRAWCARGKIDRLN